MKKKFNRLKLQIDSLTVFSKLKYDPVISCLRELLDGLSAKHDPEIVRRYSEFASALYENTSNLTDHIRSLVLQDDNFYVKTAASGRNAGTDIELAAENELMMLQEIASITSAEIKSAVDYEGFLPDWTTGYADLRYDFMEKLRNIRKTGYGIYARYSFFRVDGNQIVPVTHPDFQTLDQLFGYERERDLILKNTQAFVNGSSASNMLLYGDAGTGKSSTIKAAAASLAHDGLRIIEVRKNQLYQIPDIIEELSSNPLKFILFIDDLSFTGNDDNFSALKATLEGSISGCGDNIVIYATSNRRHLVKETFGDRTGDELHVNDTLQETMSLAARFGLTITFQKPDKDEYLNIVKSLAKEYDIDMDENELFKKAEAHAIRKNGRSPRTAKQFIELLKIGI